MRFATWSAGRDRFWGVITEEGAVALSQDFLQWRTLRDVVAANAFGELEEAARDRVPTHRTGEFDFEIPVPDPEKIICVGVNFPDRNAEYKDGQ